MQVVPRPSDQILEGGIVHPTGAVAQGPFALTKDGLAGGEQQGAVKLLEVEIWRLLRAPGKENGELHAPAFELTFVEQADAGESSNG